MNVSVTYKNTIKNKTKFTGFIKKECQRLKNLVKGISQVSVVIKRESHRNKSEEKFCCHISVATSHALQLDIYEFVGSPRRAFEKALDRCKRNLNRLQRKKEPDRKTISQFKEKYHLSAA